MSVLTKISIVLLVVLVLVASTVFIDLAIRVPNYRLAYEQQREKNAALTQHVREQLLVLRRTQSERDKWQHLTAKVRSELRGRVGQLTAELESEKARRDQLQIDLTKLQENLKSLQDNLNHAQQRADSLRKALRLARKDINGLIQKNHELDKLLKQEQARADRQERIAQVLKERIVERDEQIGDLQTKLEQAGKPAQAGPQEGISASTAKVKIEGTVTAVKNDVVSINVGSAKGVKTGMKMIVYRGSSFVAHLRIVEVDVDQAGGIVFDKVIDPIQGDRATTKLLEN